MGAGARSPPPRFVLLLSHNLLKKGTGAIETHPVATVGGENQGATTENAVLHKCPSNPPPGRPSCAVRVTVSPCQAPFQVVPATASITMGCRVVFGSTVPEMFPALSDVN